jgi:hypothetical protein
MSSAALIIHTIPQDLQSSETRKIIVESLLELRKTANAVFERVEAQISEERGKFEYPFYYKSCSR